VNQVEGDTALQTDILEDLVEATHYVEVDASVRALPTGSAIRACRRVATVASIRSSTTCDSRSSAAKCP